MPLVTDAPSTSSSGTNTTGSGTGPVCFDCMNHVPSDGACQKLTQCFTGEVWESLILYSFINLGPIKII